MVKRINSSKSSIIGEKLNSLRLSEIERMEAMAALNAAEHLVDGFAWTWTEIQHRFARVFLRPGLGS